MNDVQVGYKATRVLPQKGDWAMIQSGNVVLEASEEWGPCSIAAGIGRCPWLQPSPSFQTPGDPGHPR